MVITLKPDQEAWLQAHVATGDFSSVEEAAWRLLDERIAERDLETMGDLAWARPAVDEGLAGLDRGDVISLEEHNARSAARLAALRR